MYTMSDDVIAFVVYDEILFFVKNTDEYNILKNGIENNNINYDMLIEKYLKYKKFKNEKFTQVDIEKIKLNAHKNIFRKISI